MGLIQSNDRDLSGSTTSRRPSRRVTRNRDDSGVRSVQDSSTLTTVRGEGGSRHHLPTQPPPLTSLQPGRALRAPTAPSVRTPPLPSSRSLRLGRLTGPIAGISPRGLHLASQQDNHDKLPTFPSQVSFVSPNPEDGSATRWRPFCLSEVKRQIGFEKESLLFDGLRVADPRPQSVMPGHGPS